MLEIAGHVPESKHQYRDNGSQLSPVALVSSFVVPLSSVLQDHCADMIDRD